MAEEKMTLSKRTAHTLSDRIQRGEYKSGDKLPNENELSAELGVSRTTLREAIHILASEGILHVYRGKGTYVTDQIDKVTDFSPSDGVFHEKKLTLRDLYETRLIFEPAAAALACQRATDEEIREILDLGEKTQNQFAKDAMDNRIIQCEMNFHDALIKASHNQFFNYFLPVINETIKLTFELDFKWKLVAEGAYNDNILIMDFLQRRDVEAMRSIMTIHLRRAVWTEQLDQK